MAQFLNLDIAQGLALKILAFAASNSRTSINKTLITHARQTLSDMYDDVELTGLDLAESEIHIYSIDREAESGIPEPAQAFFEAIGRCDGIIASFPEHN